MALYVRNKEISIIDAGNKIIAVVYSGAQKIWEAVRSCFGSGAWIGKKPWLYKEAWKKSKRH